MCPTQPSRPKHPDKAAALGRCRGNCYGLYSQAFGDQYSILVCSGTGGLLVLTRAKVLALAEWRSLHTQDWDLCDFSPPAQLSEHQLMKGVNKNQDAEVIRRKKRRWP